MNLNVRGRCDSSPPPTWRAGIFALLFEGMAFPRSGEIVLRSGDKSARIFVTAGRIAWVTVSSQKVTLSERMVARGIPQDDLEAVYKESSRTQQNFAELIIEWGMLDRDVMSRLLLEHISYAFAEVLG